MGKKLWKSFCHCGSVVVAVKIFPPPLASQVKFGSIDSGARKPNEPSSSLDISSSAR